MDIAPTAPSETPYLSAMAGIRNGVAANIMVTAAVAAINATGAPERPPYAIRVGVCMYE